MINGFSPAWEIHQELDALPATNDGTPSITPLLAVIRTVRIHKSPYRTGCARIACHTLRPLRRHRFAGQGVMAIF
ncbi:MAG: hypothetical protein ACKOZW_01365 [Cyanobium sp.]